MLEIYLIII